MLAPWRQARGPIQKLDMSWHAESLMRGECWGRQMLSVWVRPRQPDGQTVRFDEAHQWLAYIQMSQKSQPAIGGAIGMNPKSPQTWRRIEQYLPVENVSRLSIIYAALPQTRKVEKIWNALQRSHSADKSDEAWGKFASVPGYRSLGLLTASPKNLCQILSRAG